MIASFIKSNKFKLFMRDEIKSLLQLLVAQDTHFSILCVFKEVKFLPQIPPELESKTDELILFTLAGFTFESIEILDNEIVFEAGFGKDNVSATLSIPYAAIAQILLHDIEILTNMSCQSLYKHVLQSDDEAQDDLQNSLSAFMSNPYNKKIFNKEE